MMKRIALMISLVVLLPNTARAEATEFPQIMNHESLMRLPAAKRAAYLENLATLIDQFETATAAAISKEDHAMLQQFKDVVAQEASLLPQATAETDINAPDAMEQSLQPTLPVSTDAPVPMCSVAKKGWTCNSSTTFNLDVGTCVTNGNPPCEGADKLVRVLTVKDNREKDTLSTAYCVPALAWAALGSARREQLSVTRGADSVAKEFNLSSGELAKIMRLDYKKALSKFSEDKKDTATALIKVNCDRTKDIVIGSLTPLLQRQVMAGSLLNSENPSVTKVLGGSGGLTGSDSSLVAGAKCMPKSCSAPVSRAARAKYRKSRGPNGSGPDCMMGGLFSTYPGPPAPRGCKSIQNWNGEPLCKTATFHGSSVPAYKQTVCNPGAWCKKGSDGKPAPYCLPVTQSVSNDCAAAADLRGDDCQSIPGVATAHDQLVQKFGDKCGKAGEFQGMFCSECGVLAKGIVKANVAAASGTACNPNTGSASKGDSSTAQ